jgi:hypothetical protein
VKLERERESLSSRSSGLKDFQVNGVANGAKGVETSFYRPHRNLLVGVSEIQTCPARRSDMSEKFY